MIRWGNNIKMDLRGTGCEGVDWINLAQDEDQWRALVNTVTDLRFYERWRISWLAEWTIITSRGTLLHGVSYFLLYHEPLLRERDEISIW